MPLTGVHYVNILAGLSDLPAIEKFYSEGLGMKVELNFPNSEAPQDIAVGTLSKTQFPDHSA